MGVWSSIEWLLFLGVIRKTYLICELVNSVRGENMRSSALGLLKFNSSEKEEKSARESRRRCPQAVFAPTVESIPKGLAGTHQQGI